MKFAHATIHCADLDASIAFYQDITGLTIQGDMRPLGSPIVFLADKEGETKVELIAAEKGKEYDGTGISLGFEVQNVKSYREELEAKGCRPTPMISPNPHVHFFFVQDPSGVTVQFIEA